ncbi:glycosyltransferase involved in cell wall biosynthesis [Microbacterium halimionae]|uniref:Glycosyltransferase involved in cell wall biosynthesis n=1 Tax=Microbacterium halimionae TaxID=1526413 RepID=A0A7W3JPK4_9MICO|nr:glycosyltransferase [Microbacterium halimionae]MBA8816665.1 glycosyltransferase involved in cell wall biosynthesis [Microbacterium halimionae]NII95148.1 glycosyltransferase involved in cell wall biosynthesis [Microbacterium halimionae]
MSTLGRIEPLRKLLDSLCAQLSERDHLVVVAQSEQDRVRQLVAEFSPQTDARIDVTTSGRGASLGRNTGFAYTQGVPDNALVLFPNDTTWFPPGSVDAIRSGMGESALGCIPVVTEDGPRFVLPPVGTPLNYETVWAVIEMGLLIRADRFRALNGFNEAIGTGAASPWQAGESTDLLLRALEMDASVAQQFRWIHHEKAFVGGIPEAAGLSPRERRWKLRAYGRGIGHVYKSHPFPIWQRWGFVAAGAVIGFRRAEYGVTDGFSAFLGRFEGVVGKTFRHASDQSAVKR